MRQVIYMEKDIIGIFLGKNKIIAASVNKRKEYRQIGFQGEEEYSYQDTADIDECIRCLESTYNVDTLSELDVSIYVIDCGANLLFKNYLSRKIEQCNYVSCIFLIDLIYILAGQRKWMVCGNKIGVDFLGRSTFICNESIRLIQEDIGDTENLITLEDIMSIFLFNVHDIQHNDIELKNKFEEEKKLWYEEKEKLLSELRKRSNALNFIASEEKTPKSNDASKLVNKRKLVMVDFRSGKGKLFQYKCTGEFVSEGDVIGTFIIPYIPYVSGNQTRRCEINNSIQANYKGKVAWLFPSHTSLGLDKSFNNRLVPVAVIGDIEDNIDSMIEWGKQQS